MKLTFQLFSLSVLSTAASVSALLECSTEINRQQGAAANQPAVCAHFEGVNPEGYREWYESNEIASNYTSMVYLPGANPSQPENGAAIHWKTDNEYVYLAVAARATGWLGFGLAEAGGMIGADMALFTASRPTEIVDAYTTDVRQPVPDDCSSDWELVASFVDSKNGFLMFEMKRLLDTGDPQDKVIINDASPVIPSHRVIAAWGDQLEVGYHGLNRARGAIRFFGTGDEKSTFETAMQQHAEGSFEVRSKNHTIASEETEYAYTCVSRQDLIDQGVLDTQDMLNMIGFEPVLSEGTEAYVHHAVVRGSEQGSCDDTNNFFEIVSAWAPGEVPLTLPDNLGAPLFGADGFQAFQIVIHYNNPRLDQGVIDNSGIRLYWTSQPRDEQVGVLSVGDPIVSLVGQPVGDGYTLHQFDCPGSCSSLVNTPVTVLREYLHMHKTGARMTNEQIRNGEVIRMGSVDYWDFDQNGVSASQQDSFDIQPGDGFKTSCYFDGNNKVFGFGSSDEMCIAFLNYYPRVKIQVTADFEFPWVCGYEVRFPPCETTYAQTTLSDEDALERTFGIVGECADNTSVVNETPIDDNNENVTSGGSILLAAHVLGVAVVLANAMG
jgi:hypothetical protein